MSIGKHVIYVGGSDVEAVRIKVNGVNIRVCPPDGRVRTCVLQAMSDTAVRLAISSELPRIRHLQARFEA